MNTLHHEVFVPPYRYNLDKYFLCRNWNEIIFRISRQTNPFDADKVHGMMKNAKITLLEINRHHSFASLACCPLHFESFSACLCLNVQIQFDHNSQNFTNFSVSFDNWLSKCYLFSQTDFARYQQPLCLSYFQWLCVQTCRPFLT